MLENAKQILVSELFLVQGVDRARLEKELERIFSGNHS